MNKWIGIGRLCKEPEITTAQNGNMVAKYRLAVNRDFKREGQPEADFLNCIAFGKCAEFALRYLRKGMRIAVEGRIQTGSYDKDGVRHYTTDIVVDRHEFCESKSSGESVPAVDAPAEAQGYEEVTDEDLPF